MAGDGDRTLKHKGLGYDGGPPKQPEFAIAPRGETLEWEGEAQNIITKNIRIITQNIRVITKT